MCALISQFIRDGSRCYFFGEAAALGAALADADGFAAGEAVAGDPKAAGEAPGETDACGLTGRSTPKLFGFLIRSAIK